MEKQDENEINTNEKDDKTYVENLKLKKEIFENINSPKIIQEILQLSTKSEKVGLQLENNIIKSLLSFNRILLPILDDEYSEINENSFNPYIISQNKRNTLYKLNFEENNFNNDFLNQKVYQYNELRQKIKEFKELKNNEEIKEKLNEEKSKEKRKENELKIEEINKKLFLVGHPLINLFEDEINIKEIKNEIEKEYLNNMKDNTNYKYTIPQQNNNLFGLALNQNAIVDDDEEDENNDADDISISHDHSSGNQDDASGSGSNASNISVEFYGENLNVNVNNNENIAPNQNIVEINENNIENIDNQIEEGNNLNNNIEQNNNQNEEEEDNQ